MCCHGTDFKTRGSKTKTTMSSFSLMGIHLDSLHLFKAELEPEYVNRAHGTPVGSEPFLPSIVSCHDMAQSKPPTVFTPFNHTHRQVVSLRRGQCLPSIKTAALPCCMHALRLL